MNYNPNSKTTWWFKSDENMILMHNLFSDEIAIIDENQNLRELGADDCIEQTYHAYCTYNDPNLLQGIKNCWKFNGKKYKPQRYPISYPDMPSMSRDHIIYSLMTFLQSNMSKEELENYVTKLPIRIGDTLGKTMNPELWLWCRLIAGKRIGKLYYPLQLLMMIIYYNWNRIINKIAKFNLYQEDHPSTYTVILNEDKPKKIIRLANKLYPIYALKLVANMTSVCPDNWFIKKMRKIGLKMTPNYNYVIKQLFKQSLTAEEIQDLQNYPAIYAERWSVILNPLINDRPSYRIIEYRNWEGILSENLLDKDYAIWLINNSVI